MILSNDSGSGDSMNLACEVILEVYVDARNMTYCSAKKGGIDFTGQLLSKTGYFKRPRLALALPKLGHVVGCTESRAGLMHWNFPQLNSAVLQGYRN